MTPLTGDQLAALETFDTPTVANAIAHLKGSGQFTPYTSTDVRCGFPELRPIVGYALTCRETTTTPQMESGRPFAPVYRAIAQATGPSIIVCQDVGPLPSRSCHLGDVMATTMQALGAKGFITDGGIRDLAGIRDRAPGFQVFSVGAVPSAGEPSLVDVGTSVTVCGMTVENGDLLHADANGVLVVPTDIVPELLVESRRVLDHEAAVIAYIRSSRFELDSYLDGSYKAVASS